MPAATASRTRRYRQRQQQRLQQARCLAQLLLPAQGLMRACSWLPRRLPPIGRPRQSPRQGDRQQQQQQQPLWHQPQSLAVARQQAPHLPGSCRLWWRLHALTCMLAARTAPLMTRSSSCSAPEGLGFRRRAWGVSLQAHLVVGGLFITCCCQRHTSWHMSLSGHKPERYAVCRRRGTAARWAQAGCHVTHDRQRAAAWTDAVAVLPGRNICLPCGGPEQVAGLSRRTEWGIG
mmetsp:Transcript_34403/g.76424  ORF Transcript_34403/g.76424 Transcript_34403/m.76424 type:complete len:233 (+) Transcript_34403:200-898(+)